MSEQQPVVDALIKGARTCERTWALKAFTQLTVKFRDGQFKKAKFNPGEEFFFESAYIGKTDNVVLTFKPVDTEKPFIQAELSPTDAFKQFDGFEQFLAMVLDETGSSTTYSGGRDALLRIHRREKVERARAAKKEAKEKADAEKREAASFYENDPLWGAF